MSGRRTRSIVALLACGALSCGALASDGPVDRRELEAFLDGVIELQLKTAPTAGATVAVVKDGEILLAKGYGWADVDRKIAVDPQGTLFRAGSVAKLLTWTAVMQLVEQGKLDLDADVNQYLRHMQIPATFPEPVTLRNLMTHSAGFEDGMIGYMFAPSPSEFMPLGEALARHMPARVRPPARNLGDGTDCVYSNLGTALAGYIVELVAGMPFDEYVERHVFAPLNMNSSTFREPLPRELAQRLAEGYMMRDGAFVPRQFELGHDFAPAGSLSNTSVDMARFMIAHLQPESATQGRLLEPATLRLMHTRALGPDPSFNGMTLGFFESWINGRRTLGHGGAGLAFHAQLLLVPDANLGLFVSYNNSEAAGAGNELIRVFMDRYFPLQLEPIRPRSDAATRNAQYVGIYRTLRRSYTKSDKLIAAGADVPVRAMPDGTLLFAASNGQPKRWIEVGDGVFRSTTDDSHATFKRVANGRLRLVRGFVAEPLERISAFESFGLHSWLLLVALGLFISMAISTVRQHRNDRDFGPRMRWARLVLALGGVLLLAFVIGTLLTLLTLDDLVADLLTRVPGGLYVSLTFVLLAIPAIAMAALFCVVIWRRRLWTLRARIHYSMTTAAALVVLAILQYWNLIGYRFG